MTCQVTERYLKECAAPDSRLRAVVTRASFPPRYFEGTGTRMMARPFFVEETEIRRAADDMTAVFHLLLSLPQRLFGGDLAAFSRMLGFDERQTVLMRRLAGCPPQLFGRADLYHDGTGFKLLEFNVGSQLGGIDQAQVLPALMNVAAFRDFAEQEGLRYVHMGERIAQSLRLAAQPVTGDREPVIALVEADGTLAPLLALILPFEEMLREQGLDVRLAEISQLVNRSGKLYLGSTPIDAVLRYFAINHLDRDSRAETLQPIFDAHEQGGTVLVTTLESLLYGNKACLALLSQPSEPSVFSAAERELLDRVLPWTRLLTAASDDLIDQCRAERAELVLKPYNGHGGHGITVGWGVTDQQWAQALDSARSGRYVVQRRVRQRLEPVADPHTGQVGNWIACWSTYLTPLGYSGSHIRAVPADQPGVINRAANAATRLTGVFHY